MNNYVFLLTLSFLLRTCARNSVQVQSIREVKKNTIQLANTAVLNKDSVQVDNTFTNISVTNDSTRCKIYGPVLARSDGKIGYVDFDEKIAMYCITYTFPGLTDEQWTGYVCNLPDDYKKRRLKVGFVGRYYAAYRYIKGKHAADTPLYLILEKIKLL